MNRIKVVIVFLVVILVSVLNLKVSLRVNREVNLFKTFNFESLANIENLNPCEGCKIDPILYPLGTYQHNASEAYETIRAETERGFGGGIVVVIKGLEIPISGGVGIGVTTTWRVPDCKDSNGNVCEKAHLKNPPIKVG